MMRREEGRISGAVCLVGERGWTLRLDSGVGLSRLHREKLRPRGVKGLARGPSGAERSDARAWFSHHQMSLTSMLRVGPQG